MQAGVKTNVIPSYAEADLDTRILPGQKVDDWIAYLKATMNDDQVEIEIIGATEATESPTDVADYAVINSVIKKRFSEAAIAPSLTTGTTDSRFFRLRGIPSYGLFPVMIPMKHAGMIHGIDEQISINNMVMGTEVMTELLENLCLN